MKLFITNKADFEAAFPKSEDGRFYGSKKMHIAAFNQLQASVLNGMIPAVLTPPYNDEGVAVLDIVTIKRLEGFDAIYYYEYTTTAS